MSNPKQHHYVPKVYLRNFCFDKNKEQIYCFDKVTKKEFFTNIDNVAQEKDFYLDLSREDKIYYETFFSQNVEPFLKKLLNYVWLLDAFGSEESPLLDNYYRSVLSRMLSYQILRTRSARNFMRKKAEVVNEQIINDLFNFPIIKTNDSYKKIVEQYRMLDENKFREIVFPIVFEENRIVRYSEAIDKMLCTFYSNKTQIEYITSDCPVVIHRIGTDKLGLGYAGIGYADCMIFYPINPHLAVMLFHKNSSIGSSMLEYENRRISIVQEKIVFTLNKLQLLQANRQVYSKNPFNIELI